MAGLALPATPICRLVPEASSQLEPRLPPAWAPHTRSLPESQFTPRGLKAAPDETPKVPKPRFSDTPPSPFGLGGGDQPLGGLPLRASVYPLGDGALPPLPAVTPEETSQVAPSGGPPVLCVWITCSEYTESLTRRRPRG